jgi:hypothetical protein
VIGYTTKDPNKFFAIDIGGSYPNLITENDNTVIGNPEYYTSKEPMDKFITFKHNFFNVFDEESQSNLFLF